MMKTMNNIQFMGEKLEPKWLGPYTTIEVKESGAYTVKDKNLKIMKKVIPIDQVKSHS